MLVTEPFERVARSSALARGYGKLPIIVMPSDFDDLDDARLRAVIADRIDEVEAALLRTRV